VRIERRTRDGILDGTVTVLFRRWKRPLVVAGREYRTTAGRLAVVAADVVDPAAITATDARSAGCDSPEQVLAELRGEPGDPVYRLRVRPAADPDPREVLANQQTLTDAERGEIRRRLERLDRASSHGPWTASVLAAIADRPATRAAELASAFERDLLAFKADVRKLKNLGLTISLEVGYQLSARGRSYLGR
jgi:hypothetical protein